MLTFLKSPLGNAVILLFLIGSIGAVVVLNSLEAGKVNFNPPEGETYDYEPEVYKRDIPRFNMPGALVQSNAKIPEPKAEATSPEAAPAVSRPVLARQPQAKVKAKPELPLNLFTGKTPDEQPELSLYYAPYGRLVPCELTITVESNSIDTPIIGLVTEDVVHAGKVIIPAGAEVHGRASESRTRDRIAATGTWNFVWRTQDKFNGTELTLQGIALDREYNFNTGQWGLRDGSAGLKGYLIESDSWNEIKLFASTFLAAATQGLKEYDNFITDTGSSVQIAQSSAGNAALDGATAVMVEYAEQIRETIQRDGYYIRVPTGKQFYVYVTQTIDAREGSRGNVSNKEIWNHENTANER